MLAWLLRQDSGNTFVGQGAGDGTDDGVNNVAVGIGALSANAVGENVAIGNSCISSCVQQVTILLLVLVVVRRYTYRKPTMWFAWQTMQVIACYRWSKIT